MKLTKLKSKGFSALFILLFLAVIVLLNVFVGILTERFFIKADLTEAGIFTISDRAEEFLRDVNETIDVIVLADESAWRANNIYDMVSNILRNYAASSGGNIKIQYVNPDLNSFNGPKYNNSLSELKEAYTELENMSRNDIIFLSQRRATIVNVPDLFAQTSDNMGRPMTTGLRSDQEIISALIYVLNEDIARIVFIDNHQEITLELFTLVFERTGYVSQTINLALEDIPEDTVLLVSAGPQFDFLNDEIVKLEQFLGNGGNFLFLYDPYLPSMPLMETFLAEWGMVIEDKIVFDDVYVFIHELGLIGAHVVNGLLPSTELAEEITTTEMPLAARLPRPIRAETTRAGYTLTPLIQTFSSSSFAKDVSEGGVESNIRDSADESGPFVLSYHARRLVRNQAGNQVNASLIVTGVSLFEDIFLANFGNSFYNAFFISNIATDFNPFGERVFIPTKDLSNTPLVISAGATRNILITMVIVLPLLIIAAGIFVWRKRRHQ